MAYYKEKDYLFKRNENEKLEECKQLIEEKKQIESIEYNYLIKKYYEYIKMIGEFLKSLELYNSLEYGLAIRYLIYNGYLSYNNKFEDRFIFYKEIVSKPGINVIDGEGCCRNISDLYKDIMDYLNMYCEKYYCYLSYHKIGKRLFNKEANHVANIIEYKDNLYIMDLYNNNLLRFINSFEAKAISYVKNLYLGYKPYFDYIVENYSLDDIDNRLHEFEESSKKEHISELIWFDNIMSDTMFYISDNKNLFKEFSEDTNNIKKEISLNLK